MTPEIPVFILIVLAKMFYRIKNNMDRLLDHMSDKHFRVVKQLASQIAGRKPGRKHYDFKVAREHQHRKHQSAFKDIAAADRTEVASWIRKTVIIT